jgi:catechol 2,3-dioxygenase-like lactoylglutathione lyase family enzyme
MSATATLTSVKFQVSLNVTDLTRSVHFYRTLLAAEPSMNANHQVRFELNSPPLVLYLIPGARAVGGSLNHVGLRLPDSAALVEVQRRLEEAGIETQRQEGVECCYARQTKFWVTDPDVNLWELYVLEEDIEHSGFEDAPHAAPPAPARAAVWEHRLTEPIPRRIPVADGSVDEVRLEGTCNARLEDLRPAEFLAEVRRVLRPSGKVVMHGLAGDRALEAPGLPGLAALVQRVPAAGELIDALGAAGFTGMYYEHFAAITCLPVSGELREIRLTAWRPAAGATAADRRVLYKGPLEKVVDDFGMVYPRGQGVAVRASAWEALRQGPAAGQFLLLPGSPPSDRS